MIILFYQSKRGFEGDLFSDVPMFMYFILAHHQGDTSVWYENIALNIASAVTSTTITYSRYPTKHLLVFGLFDSYSNSPTTTSFAADLHDGVSKYGGENGNYRARSVDENRAKGRRKVSQATRGSIAS